MEKLNLFEGSLNLIKPDHFEFRYEILPRLEIIGEIAKYCEVKPTKEDWEEHYIEHKDKPFFIPMIRAFTGRDISVIFLCGPNIIEQSRKTIGENYDPRKLESGTIRRDFCNLNEFEKTLKEKGYCSNVMHASNSIKSAIREYAVWEKYFK